MPHKLHFLRMKAIVYSVTIITTAMCFAGMINSFTKAAEIPVPAFADWTLSGNGKIVKSNILQITGNGKDTCSWTSPGIKHQPGGTYRFSVEMQGVDAPGACLPCGPLGFSRDYTAEKGVWQTQSYCFRVPDAKNEDDKEIEMHLKVGQWESSGTFQFRNVKLEPVMPVIKEFETPQGNIWLGEGEAIRDGKYKFQGEFNGNNTTIHQPFVSASGNVTFNSNRWCLGSKSDINYCFQFLSPRQEMPFPLYDEKIVINTCYHSQGEGVIETSSDGENWAEQARVDKVGTTEIVLPKINAAIMTYLRIRGLEGCNFQIDRIGYEGSLPEMLGEINSQSFNFQGETLFAVISGAFKNIPMPKHVLVQLPDGEINGIEHLDTPDDEGNWTKVVRSVPLKKSRVPEEIAETTFDFMGRMFSLSTQTHPLERSDYGYHLASGNNSAWWCEADWKISRTRSAPELETSKPI
jgi:hypothetical protein